MSTLVAGCPWRGRCWRHAPSKPGRAGAATPFIAAALSLILLASVTAFAPAQEAAPAPHSRAPLVAQQQQVFHRALAVITPSIVRIDTIGGAQPVPDENGAAPEPGGASGFRQADGPTTGLIWSSDGYILTSSFNFVRDPLIITVTLADGRRFVARLIARDFPARLALLKIDASDLPPARWIGCHQLRAGQWALAAGLGHGGDRPTLSVGILSALRRMSGQAVQTDAKISPANYGGPLIDIEGRVIGLCVPLGLGEEELAGVEWYDSGIGFAIHEERVRESVARLQQGYDLHRGLLGIQLDMREPVVEAETGAGKSDAHPPGDGLRIVGTPRGPAAEAGLAADDVITRVDGEPTPRLVDFRRALGRKAAGDTIAVTYRRGEAVATVRLELAEAEEFRKPATSQSGQ